jgi:hypothetical protein
MEFFSVGAQARGVIAIGAEAEGVIALGAVARGFVAIGQMATGVIAIGQLARGVFVVGQLGVGVWSYGQGAVAITRAVGMLAVGARSGGMLKLSLWPDPPKNDPPLTVTAQEVLDGVVDRGWVEVELSVDSNAVVPSVEGVARPDWQLDDAITAAARTLGRRRGWLLIERTETLNTQEEGGFREAPARLVRVVARDAQWRAETSVGRRVAGVIGVLALTAVVGVVSLWPVFEALVSLL